VRTIPDRRRKPIRATERCVFAGGSAYDSPRNAANCDLVEVRVVEVSWLVSMVASLLLIVTPGRSMTLVMSRSIAQVPAGGVATAGGCTQFGVV